MFDSGFGGLNILAALCDLLTQEDFVYLGDSARAPYGSRSVDEVQSFSREIAHYLIDEFDIKMLVVACNTASAVALEELRQEVSIPVIGVIDAAVRAARQATRSGRVGVIGTIRTISSGVYQERMADLAFVGQACPGLVEFVERGETDSEELVVLLERLLSPVRRADVDTLLLGCTHYPYLAKALAQVCGREVVLISSAEETAFEVRDLLVSARSLALSARQRSVAFYCTGSVEEFVTIGSRLFGSTLVEAERAQLLWRAGKE
ncbi:MAG: glutamate racemase [Ferrimicrobium sp.]